MKKKFTRHLIAAGITLLVYLVLDYLYLPAYNIYSLDTWIWVICALFGFGILDQFLIGTLHLRTNANAATTKKGRRKQGNVISVTMDESQKGKVNLGKVFVITAMVLAVIGGICYLFSSTVFQAKRYAAIAGPIEARDFIADTPQSETISDIALMDTDSARIIGSRALGSLSELVSQFEINHSYTQINLQSKPMKVAPLEYADFFKWWNNRSEGIPGYIAVDPVANTSNYVKLDQPMIYSESAKFGENLHRKLRFTYRTAMFGNTYFEIDESGTPYYVTSVLKHDIVLFGGTDVKGVITLNPCTGETTYYDIAEVPSWIDIVYDGYMLTQRYDWHGLYSGGFWNSIFGNKDCKQVTDDFGYKMFDDDVWVFTGVTSIVSDESNIGFVLMNSRTAEIRYYAIPGAEEYSVMASAEGEVQHLNYTASFPSIINVENQPTYIMVLKDKGSLVKQYALTHVERYNIVVTGETQQEVVSKYKTALAENGMLTHDEVVSDDASFEPVKVQEISYLVLDGNSYAYILTEDDRLLKVDCGIFETIVRVKPRDEIRVVLTQEDNGIYQVINLALDDA